MIEVYGASDDLIEVDGDISEEWSALSDGASDDGGILAFSDGTVLRVAYSPEGIWRVTPLARGTSLAGIRQCAATDDDSDYSDRATFDGEVAWVVFGSAFKRRA